MDDTTIDHIVRRLARPTKSGGHVIERAAVLAEGAHFADIEAWIIKSGGEPEVLEDAGSTGGVHMGRERSGRIRDDVVPVRYLLPSGSLPAVPAVPAVTAT
ncbi:MAG: hypothetical protein QOG85_294 [Gaiellaceae bacterium]|jgi:hypothetical protein|nr:hypothetical protein [Gaiellaceae bacterium]